MHNTITNTNAHLPVVNLYIHSEYEKIRTRKNSIFGHFSHNVSSLYQTFGSLQMCTHGWRFFFGKSLTGQEISKQTNSNKLFFLDLFKGKNNKMHIQQLIDSSKQHCQLFYSLTCWYHSFLRHTLKTLSVLSFTPFVFFSILGSIAKPIPLFG